MNLLINFLVEPRTKESRRGVISCTDMDETSSGYSSRGESHSEEAERPGKGGLPLSTLAKPSSDRPSSVRLIEGAKVQNNASLTLRENAGKDGIQQPRVLNGSVDTANAQMHRRGSSEGCVPSSSSRNDEFQTARLDRVTNHSTDVLNNDSLRSWTYCLPAQSQIPSPGKASARDAPEADAIIEQLRLDNLELQRQLSSSYQFFYRVVDDLKTRLLEAECYAKMVKDQLKEYNRSTRQCTCNLQLRQNIDQNSETSSRTGSYSGTGDNASVSSCPRSLPYRDSKPSTPRMRKVLSADDLLELTDSRGLGACSALSVSGKLSTLEVKQDLRERNRELRQQIEVLREVDTCSRRGSKEENKEKHKQKTVMPNLASSSCFSAAMQKRGGNCQLTKQKKQNIAIDEVRWIRKPPLSGKKRAVGSKTHFNQQSGFRTINVQSWSADSCKS